MDLDTSDDGEVSGRRIDDLGKQVVEVLGDHLRAMTRLVEQSSHFGSFPT
jgi:hypothetical protein